MTIHEATLYGDLVHYLRDTCATQIAELKGTAVEFERKTLDEVIRTWFFTPQDQLYGYTPQKVIRNEELGIENVIPADRLGDMFDHDCPICEAMKNDAEADITEGHSHGWGFGLAPDMSLLDGYDPEGWEERWRIEEERMETHRSEMKKEAEAFPLVGADDSETAQQVSQQQAFLDDDISF
ncbi:MAG: hypothetical protein GY759_16310 [Chloroflexi bacterium]|nr:hypothetical protein [Chloroflexota bacterium]